MERPKARDGWRLTEGARCYRYTKEGRRLKNQVVVVGFEDDGLVRVQDMKTLALGVWDVGRLQAIARRKDEPASVLRYRMNVEAVREVSQRSQKRRGGARR